MQIQQVSYHSKKNMTDKFTVLHKVLKALGLSEDRAAEIIARIQEWLAEDAGEKTEEDCLPYYLRDNFLSVAELNFYRVLVTAVSNWAVIFGKTSLGDLFYTSTGEQSQNTTYRNKIVQKHVDFVLCDPLTMLPLLAIELDDKSHQRTDRQARDAFVDQVFAAAGLPLVHIVARASYPAAQLDQILRQKVEARNRTAVTSPIPEARPSEPPAPPCPNCNTPMVLRTARSGQNVGNQFWGCPNYPRCKAVLPCEKPRAN
jgi:hypothetical protein